MYFDSKDENCLKLELLILPVVESFDLKEKGEEFRTAASTRVSSNNNLL